MAKDTEPVWEEVSEELASDGKWDVSSVVVPTPPPAAKAEEEPTHDDAERGRTEIERDRPSGPEETPMRKEEPKEAAPDVEENTVSEPAHDQATPEDEKDTKPKPEPTSDDDAYTQGWVKWLDEEDERSERTTQFVRREGLAKGPEFPKSLEMDPESGEMIVNGIRESELSTTTKETAKAIEEEGKSARSQGTRRSAQVTSKAGSPGKGVTDSTKKVKGRRTAGRVASRHASATGRGRRSRGRGAELRDPGVRVHHAGQSKMVTNKPRSKKQTEWNSPDDSRDFDPDEAWPDKTEFLAESEGRNIRAGGDK